MPLALRKVGTRQFPAQDAGCHEPEKQKKKEEHNKKKKKRGTIYLF